MFIRLGLTLSGLMFSLAFMAAPVSAHAEFVTSSPAPGSSQDAPPTQVRITFSENVTMATSIVVTGPSGATVSGATSISANTATTPLQGAGPGIYRVQWSNVSADDGDAEDGSFAFAVGAEAATVLARTGTGLTADTDLSLRYTLGGVALVLALVLTAAVVLRPRFRGEA